ncbi:MAG: hypothetical protein U1U88_002021 [Lawsonella clevelandensis]
MLAGPIVLTPVADRARATWSARVRDTLDPSGIRIARPFRATDGRTIVGDWRADHYGPGVLQNRPDEVIATSLRLHDALAPQERPRFLVGAPASPWTEADYFSMADRAAFHPAGLELLRDYLPHGTGVDGGLRADIAAGWSFTSSLQTYEKMSTLLPKLSTETCCLEHCLSQEVPHWSPILCPTGTTRAWAAGVIVVDALNWAGADADLPQRWRHLSEWPQQLLRAYLFRLGLHLVHRHSAASAYDKLLHTGVVIADFVANSTSVEPAVVPSTEPPAAEITVDEGADSSAHLDVSPEPTSWEDTGRISRGWRCMGGSPRQLCLSRSRAPDGGGRHFPRTSLSVRAGCAVPTNVTAV